MILISNDFGHKIKKYNFDPYNILLTITTNIPVLLMTAFVLQSHNYGNLHQNNSCAKTFKVTYTEKHDCSLHIKLKYAIFKFL